MSGIEGFCAHHFAYHGISTDRQTMTRRQLTELEAFIGRPLESIEPREFERFLVSQIERGLHVNTVLKHANAIRPFFEWAWSNGLIDDGRYMRLRRVKNPRGSGTTSKPRPYSRTELKRFWAELERTWPKGEDRWVRRWADGKSPYRRVWQRGMRLQIEAIVRLALDLGMRREEIFRAQLDDIHPDNAYVVVRGAAKGNGRAGAVKEREVPYTEAARAAVADWLEFRRLLLSKRGEDHDAVWVVVDARAAIYVAKPLSFTGFKGQLTTVGGWELHRFRHTCATERLRAGMKLENLQRFLGHARIQQTLAYAEIVRDDIHRDALRTEPEFASAVA